MAANSYVLDTHVGVSIFHKKRKEALIDALIEKDLIIISASEQEKEFLHVTHYPEIAQLLLGNPENYVQYLESIAGMFSTGKRFSLLTDYKDNYLVDLAWQTGSILVSDDRTFKPLRLLKQPKWK